jgi:hypothetical protein
VGKLSNIFRFGYGALDDLGMFSPTEKALDLIPQKKGTGQQMLSQIEQIGRKSTKDEMMFTGLEDTFATSPKVTSDELKQYLKENKANVQEIVKSKNNAIATGQLDTFTNVSFSNNQIIRNLAEGDSIALRGLESNVYDNSTVYSQNWRNLYDIKKISLKDLDKDNVKQMGTEQNIDESKLFEIKVFNQEKQGEYLIKGSNDYGYEVYQNGKLSKPEDRFLFPSIAEAELYVNGLRKKEHNKTLVGMEELTSDNFVDLLPKHEQYTLPGGDNYKEILLTMPKLPDEVVGTLGKFDGKSVRVGRENLIQLNDQFSDVASKLKRGEIVELEMPSGSKRVKLDPKTNELLLLKEPFYVHTHFDEANVVVFSRTTDRVDADGKKILFVEEMQSDLAQRGRGQFDMGLNEKKKFINTKNKQIFGDILQDLERLSGSTNINDLKGFSGTKMPNIEDNKLNTIKDTKLGFDVDGYSLNDLIKKQMTKYKFFSTKDKNIQYLTNQGLSKQNVNEYKTLVDKPLQEEIAFSKEIGIDETDTAGYRILSQSKESILNNIGDYETKLYEDVSDFVPISAMQNKIKNLKRKVFSEIVLESFNKNAIPEDIMNYDDLNEAVSKGNTLPFAHITHLKTLELRDLYYTPKELKQMKAKNDKEYIKYNTLSEDYVNSPEGQKELQDNFDSQAQELIYEAIPSELSNFGDIKKLVNEFDYPSQNKMEVLKQLKSLNSNLEEAVNYEVKLNPLKNEFPSAPFVGSTDRFIEIGIKRLLNHANENGYDGISFSQGIIHAERWNQPQLKEFYDKKIPNVANNILKGTGSKLESKNIYLDEKSFRDMLNAGGEETYVQSYGTNADVIKSLEISPSLRDNYRGYIGNSPTIYLDKNLKDYVDSGISFYTPIVATGLAGSITANQLIGSEEDIIEEERT